MSLVDGYSNSQVRKVIIKAYYRRCQYCNNIFQDERLQIDHIDPVSKGGKNKIENCTVSCMNCNEKKANSYLLEPGRSLLKLIAQRKKAKIIEILSRQQKRNRLKPTNDRRQMKKIDWEMDEGNWGEVEFDRFKVRYLLPINWDTLFKFNTIINCLKLRIKDDWHYKLKFNGTDTDADRDYGINWGIIKGTDWWWLKRALIYSPDYSYPQDFFCYHYYFRDKKHFCFELMFQAEITGVKINDFMNSFIKSLFEKEDK